MLGRLHKFRAEYVGYRDFRSLPLSSRKVVFYSEGRGYWTYFAPIFHALREKHEQQVIYVTSGADDPILHGPPQGLLTFYIGLGAIRTLYFFHPASKGRGYDNARPADLSHQAVAAQCFLCVFASFA
jgi:YidC/Oxa1 family membrane protein insertase